MSSSESELDAEAYSAAIKRLQTKDPDFYQFLKENDKQLLEFHDSDDAAEDSDVDEEAAGDEDDKRVPQKQGKLSASRIENLKRKLEEGPDIQVCKQLVSLMKVVVGQGSSSEDQSLAGIDSDIFNNAIKLCLVELIPALYNVLKLHPDADSRTIDPSKSKLWKKLQATVKSYLIDILKLLNLITQPSSLKQMLKHVVNLLPFFAKHVKLLRILLKKMTNIWSTAEETVRLTALLVIVRGLKCLPEEYYAQVMKHMYFAYVKNSKFTSPTSSASINFMKRSLAEIYAMNPSIAYEHCFIYLRQLCIHLRNAVTTKKKESYQTVYNWQYVHCVQFWAHLICTLHNNDAIKTLIYPLVQTVIGTINLIPTIKYVPLRFCLSQVLIQVSKDTEVYIPVAPLISGALGLTDFNKKSMFSKKPVNFSCALKASKAQLQESGFKDGVISEVCRLLTDYFSIYAHTVGFPELVLPTIVHIKAFLKKNKVGKYGQQLKAVLDKLQQNSEYISQQRKNVPFKITDSDKIHLWEEKMKHQPLPLLKRSDKTNQNGLDPPPQKKRKHTAE